MQQWWGEPGPTADARAAICADDGDRVPAPLGRPCLWCNEPLREGDRGVMQFFVGPPGSVSFEPVHIECQMRQVLGGPAHLSGRCTCQGGTCDPDDGMTARQAALAVWSWWVEGQR